MEEQGLLYAFTLFVDYCYNIQKKSSLHDWMSITQDEFHSTMDQCKIGTYGMHVPLFLPPSFPFKFLKAYAHQHDTYPEPTPAIDLTAKQWHTLSHDHQYTWHKLSNATKAFILGIEEDVNLSPNCKIAPDGPHEDIITSTSVSEMPLPDTNPSYAASNVSKDADLPLTPTKEVEYQDNLQSPSSVCQDPFPSLIPQLDLPLEETPQCSPFTQSVDTANAHLQADLHEL
jgi:hypothetical protein